MVDDIAATVLVVQNSTDDPPGRVGTWLREAGCVLEVVRGFAGEPVPTNLDGIDGVVVLGGDMGAYDDATHPWLSATKELLREAVRIELPTLGICLGHQLLAVATGGAVERVVGDQQGGSCTIVSTAEAAADPLFVVLRSGSPSVQWNHDVVSELPPAAVVLARTEAGIQALRVGPRAWGLQSHPEVDVETVRLWAQEEIERRTVAAEVANRWLADIEAADQAMVQAWRPVAERFAELVRGFRVST
ncbi:MAG TPA: type 1 glutamine amidotransferase [Microlunatus sp.]